jgi:hypothetical protein
VRWYKVADHGDTLNGQMLEQRRVALAKDIAELRDQASLGGPQDVLQRWRGELRRKMLLLPASDRVYAMSMSEVNDTAKVVSEVRRLVSRYSESRMKGIIGA